MPTYLPETHLPFASCSTQPSLRTLARNSIFRGGAKHFAPIPPGSPENAYHDKKRAACCVSRSTATGDTGIGGKSRDFRRLCNPLQSIYGSCTPILLLLISAGTVTFSAPGAPRRDAPCTTEGGNRNRHHDRDQCWRASACSGKSGRGFPTLGALEFMERRETANFLRATPYPFVRFGKERETACGSRPSCAAPIAYCLGFASEAGVCGSSPESSTNTAEPGTRSKPTGSLPAG
jgi:hypothetical protein